MVEFRSLQRLLPRSLRELPADLAAVVAIVVATNLVVFTPVLGTSLLRVPLGLVFVLFVPGYAFVAALFPEAGESPTGIGAKSEPEAEIAETGHFARFRTHLPRSGIDGLERFVLSIGLSVAIGPLLGLVLNYTPFGIRLVPVAITLTVFTLVTTGVAAVRRWELSPEERFQVPYREWYATGRAELLKPDERGEMVLNALIVIAVVLALSSAGHAVMTQPQGEQFSAVHILTEDDDGELVAGDYPTEFEQGESQELVVGVDNQEQQPMEYTVVVVEQRIRVNGDEVDVEEQNELDRFELQLGHDQSWYHKHEVAPTITGEDTRLLWLLYPDSSAPTDYSTETTEHYVDLWIEINND